MGHPADCAGGGGSAGVGSVALCAGMFLKNLRVVFSGYEQEPSPALVRHDAVREPGEGAALLCAAEEGKVVVSRPDIADTCYSMSAMGIFQQLASCAASTTITNSERLDHGREVGA